MTSFGDIPLADYSKLVEPSMSKPAMIVAEVSVNWPGPNEGRLSSEFERVITVNRERGYILHSWKLSRVATDLTINETIIAVFALQAPVT